MSAILLIVAPKAQQVPEFRHLQGPVGGRGAGHSPDGPQAARYLYRVFFAVP
jgi:hypothetical protein